MRLGTNVLLCGAIAVAMAGGALQARASSPIATFVVTSTENAGNNPAANTFVYVGQTPTTSGNPGFFYTTLDNSDPTPALAPVTGTFTFDSGVSPGLIGVPINATLEVSAEAIVPTNVTTVGPTTFLSQPLVDVTINITATTGNPPGVTDGSNLLSEGGTGNLGGAELDVTGSATGSQLTGDTVNYTSDYLPGDLTDVAWDIELNSITPTLGTSTPPLLQTIGNSVDAVAIPEYLNSFTAAGSPSFSATTPGVPEPASLSLLGLGAASLLLKKRKNVR